MDQQGQVGPISAPKWVRFARLSPPDGTDNQIGYVDVTHDGRDDDFHLMSTEGRFSGSLAPVFDAVTRRPAFLPVAELVDAIQSVAIDRGEVSFSFVNEPAPNGGFINLGAFGNTVQASKSPAQYLLITLPDGNEDWPAEQTFPIRWRSDIIENNDTGGRGTDYATAVLADDPVGYWQFKEGGKTAVDSAASGVANDGTYQNGVTQGIRSFLLQDLAVGFDGNNDLISIPHDTELTPTALTVEALIFPQTGIASSDTVLMKSTSSSWNDGYGLYHSSGEIRFFVNDNTGSSEAGAAIALDTWSHVVATYDGSEIRLYINGALADTQVYGTPINHSLNGLQIGQGAGNTGYTWTGFVDDRNQWHGAPCVIRCGSSGRRHVDRSCVAECGIKHDQFIHEGWSTRTRVTQADRVPNLVAGDRLEVNFKQVDGVTKPHKPPVSANSTESSRRSIVPGDAAVIRIVQIVRGRTNEWIRLGDTGPAGVLVATWLTNWASATTRSVKPSTKAGSTSPLAAGAV